MLGGDEKHQTHCNDSADEKRQNGFFPGKGGILLLKPVEKHRQNLLMFCFFHMCLTIPLQFGYYTGFSVKSKEIEGVSMEF